MINLLFFFLKSRLLLLAPCQGEGGSAGENGSPGPMVSNIILIPFKFDCDGMQY